MANANTTALNSKGMLLNFLRNGIEWPHPFSREWLYAPELQVYLRKGNRYINAQRIKVLEIANVEVYDQGKGIFTDFFRFAVSVCPYQGVLIESVQTERFCRFFRRQGLIELPNALPPSFVWLKETK